MVSDPFRPPTLSIRVFSAALWWLRLLLVVVTVIGVPLLALTVTGRGSLSVTTTVQPPYTVELGDGRSITKGGLDAPDEWANFRPGEEKLFLQSPPRVDANLVFAPGDTDARVVVAAMVGFWLTVAWIALVALRRIVRSAAVGEPFDPRNVARLRVLATVALLFPVANRVAVALLRRTVDTDIPVQINGVGPSPSWWSCAIVGAGLLALAEVFRQGTTLRDLERAVV